MGKNMNYIGPRVNSPSWDRERKGRDPEAAANYFLRTPTGILLKGLAKKAGVHLGSIDYSDIDSYDNLTTLEKQKMKQAFSKYNIYMAQIQVQSAKNLRAYQKEGQFPDNYTNPGEGYKYSMVLEDEEDGIRFGTPPFDTLNLERKKKSKKSKSKRKKPVKKVIKKVIKKKNCGCK